MPRKNRTGPTGQGPRNGKGAGAGYGRGRMGGPVAAGPGGNCICPSCGYTVPHLPGQPCMQKRCPQCGIPLTRE